ncbi:pyruvate decarboxylase [Schizopora paradoxa]|uniref:Pyruvate decarboxylase n=1 Tax=Schizopora paradoxa TaxID=27342 RepID=A0A0H2RT89_9AGAM|nr:pyruvate decarboxylase [Schizopora paradoxa]
MPITAIFSTLARRRHPFYSGPAHNNTIQRHINLPSGWTCPPLYDSALFLLPPPPPSIALVNENVVGKITVGRYLLDRLVQLGVTKVFGVPGDFNLGFLDIVEDHESLHWVGNCNELNAAYAADGYARVHTKSVGALVTTFGVGELSAINGIAGAFSENVPIVHIAGVPNTTQLKNKPMLHHTLGDGRFDAYEKAAAQFSIAQAHLLNKSTAAEEIDDLLVKCVTTGRPVYLTLPTDLSFAKIPAVKRLQTPLALETPLNDPEVEKVVVREIIKEIHDADKDAVILVDACAIRHHVVDETAELIKRTGFPVYSAPMGKTAVSETNDRYGGLYVGSLTHEEIRDKVEKAKLIISIGSLKSDFNSGNFTYSVPATNTVELHSTYTQIGYARYPGIGMKRLLPVLTEELAHMKTTAEKIPVARYVPVIPNDGSQVIAQDWFWPRMGKFFRSKDVIVAETGTSSFGILDVPFPDGAIFVSQILWGSIGWTVGSTLGAAMAARDLGLGRTILFVGDGSLQLTVQEISSMIRWGLKPIIFVLNNNGYTIERHLHGWDRKYNDIANWDYTALLSVFQGKPASERTGKTYTVSTRDELSALIDKPEFAAANEIQLVEVMMDKYDAPLALRKQAELSGKTNKYAE